MGINFLNSKTFYAKGIILTFVFSVIISGTAAYAQEFNPELSDEKPEAAKVETNNEPNRVIATFNGDTSTEMGFNWYTTDLFEDAKVWISETEDFDNAIEVEAEATEVSSSYGERDEDGHYIFSDIEKDEEGEPVEKEGEHVVNGYYTDEQAEGADWMYGDAVGELDLIDVTEYSYKANATDLKPNTTYYYKVGSDSGEQSEIGEFTTSGEENEAFKFVHYTDTQNAYWNENVRNEAAFGADTLKNALNTAEDADFVLHTGDVVETAEVEDEWVDLFEQSRESMMSVPMAVSAGNHDEYPLDSNEDMLPEKFNEHVNVPVTNDKIDGGSYYSFDYNGVHFISLNTNDNKKSEDNPEGKAIGEEQMNWITEDVEEARANGAEWIVLTYHKPLYSKSYHSLADEDVQKVREELTQLIDELGIDLALQGHDHVISRTNSLQHVPTEENFSNAEVEDVETFTGEDDVEYMDNPEGTVYVLPNTGGTKEYDDVYSKGADHLHEVRPELDWMTQEDMDYYNSLFSFGEQPQETEVFEESHSNNRDSSTQNFAVYEVEDDEMVVSMYQLEGDVLEGDEREVELVDQFGISKSDE